MLLFESNKKRGMKDYEKYILTHTECNKMIEPIKYLEKYTLDQKVKNTYSVFFKNLSKFTTFQPPLGQRVDGGNSKFQLEGTSFYASLERSFFDKFFYKSSFGVRR